MTSDSVTIRGYQDSDKENCRDLWRELTEHHREIYNDQSIGGKDPGHYFDDHLERIGPHRIWIAEKEGEIVGMVGLIGDDEEAEIEPVVVKREQRQKGIGKMLLRFAIQEAEKIGVKFLSIKPVMRNTDAIRVFHKIGFQNVGSLELFLDLKKEERREWMSDLRIFGLRFHY